MYVWTAPNYRDDPHAGEDLSDRYIVDSYGRLRPGDATWHHGATTCRQYLCCLNLVFTCPSFFPFLCVWSRFPLSGWVLHSSPGNESGEDRVAYTLCYVAADAPLLGKHAKHRPDDEDDLSYADWIKDFRPGSRITDHPYLPLVYEANKKGNSKT